ncbi:MAG: CPBP family intramembrane metalloprotease, partial [Acholeplasmataceae bacterium]|nr:CPBP family intramembrane metalloprotease [Acholeplasmataceae bacterium]
LLLVVVHQGLTILYLVPITVYHQMNGVSGEQLEQIIYAQGVNAVIFSGIGSLFIFSLIFKGRKRNLIERSRFNPITKEQILWSTLIGLSFVFLSLLIVNLLASLFPALYDSYLKQMEVLADASVFTVIIAVVIVAPLFEEIMFRGVIFDSMYKKAPTVVAVIIAGVLFGAYHMNIFQGAYATLIGVVMGFSLVWTKSIWAPILIHFFNNLFSIILSYTVLGVWLEQNDTAAVILSIAIALTLLPLGIYKLYKTKVEEIIEPIIEPTDGIFDETIMMES